MSVRGTPRYVASPLLSLKRRVTDCFYQLDQRLLKKFDIQARQNHHRLLLAPFMYFRCAAGCHGQCDLTYICDEDDRVNAGDRLS